MVIVIFQEANYNFFLEQQILAWKCTVAMLRRTVYFLSFVLWDWLPVIKVTCTRTFYKFVGIASYSKLAVALYYIKHKSAVIIVSRFIQGRWSWVDIDHWAPPTHHRISVLKYWLEINKKFCSYSSSYDVCILHCA